MADAPEALAGDDKIIQQAKTRFQRAESWESTARARHIADTRFAEGDSDNMFQWDSVTYAERVADKKPALTINKTRQHCIQIVNEQRENKASIQVRPVGDGATYEAAKVFEGIIRHIEYQSNATEAYESAGWRQVVGGWGYWRVTTDFVDPDSFDQEIFIRRVPDPMSVYLDPDIQEYDGSDAMWGFVFSDRSRDQAEAEHDWLEDDRPATNAISGADVGWNDNDHVREAEYYRKVKKSDVLFAAANGYVVRKSKLPEVSTAANVGDVIPTPNGFWPIVRKRGTDRFEVEWYRIIGDRITERKVGKDAWPGQYIPIVRCIGEETIIDGQLDRKGHVRSMKDPQRIYNFWSSAAVEYGAMQTQAPWLAPAEAIEGYESFWNNANKQRMSFLPYKSLDDEGRQIPAPSRVLPPTALPAAIEGMRIAQMEMMMVSGQYQAQFGEAENAKSGVAINARQRQGDKATYHYIDHQGQALKFTGKILLDLIPKIYDTPRIIKIMADNGDKTEVNVTPDSQVPYQQMVDGQPASAEAVKAAQSNENLRDKIETIFNPSVGKYSVLADVGPNFATRRQEGWNALSQIMAQNAPLMGYAGDILFRMGDFPMADEMAERIKRTIAPNILGEGPPPAVMELQQKLEQMQGLMTQMVQELADKDRQLKDRGQQIEIQDYDAETRRLAAVAKSDPEGAKVILRDMLSHVLGERIEPHIAAGAALDQAMAPQPQPQPQPEQMPSMQMPPAIQADPMLGV